MASASRYAELLGEHYIVWYVGRANPATGEVHSLVQCRCGWSEPYSLGDEDEAEKIRRAHRAHVASVLAAEPQEITDEMVEAGAAAQWDYERDVILKNVRNTLRAALGAAGGIP